MFCGVYNKPHEWKKFNFSSQVHPEKLFKIPCVVSWILACKGNTNQLVCTSYALTLYGVIIRNV